MESRRRNGLIALVVLVLAVIALVYYDMRGPVQSPTTAFAPAQSADESVEPADTPIEAPATEAASETAEPGATAANGTAVDTASAEPEATNESAAEAGAVPDTDVATADPSAGLPPDAVDTFPAPATVPSFDVVRVEPSGDTVIAGQAEPNATVEIMDGPAVIASAEANDSGEWVIALDTPLDPGTHDLAISTTSPDESVVMLSDERVTVSVPEDDTADVLVVLNAPGAPSTVLQVPPAEPAGTAAGPAESTPAVADASPPGQPAGSEVAPAGEQVAAAEPAVTPAADASTEPDAAPATVAASDESGAMPSPEPTGEQVAMAPATDETPPSTDGATPTPEPSAVAEAPAASEPVTAESGETASAGPDAVSAEPEVEVAMTPPAVEEPPAPPPPPEPKVTVAAVEAETTGALYIAGNAATGEAVRVYIDDEFIDDAIPSPTGTWLVETTMDLPAGQYLVRADQVAADGTVIARYEVPFDREVEVAILTPTGATSSTESATLTGAKPEVETVIIKRGDNLWRIARSTWGKGIRWSTIYQANNDQIRNPHWIYPGQVFVVPKGDSAWQN